MNQKKMISVFLDGIEYVINESDNTAGVFRICNSVSEILIPRTIMYNSKKYAVTSILTSAIDLSKNLKSIKFQLFSQVRSFSYNSFYHSLIESITIPTSVTEISKGWCSRASRLKEIKIMPTNPRYSIIDKKIIMGKSKIGQKNYDTIVFAMKNIETVKIPNYITTIGAYSFKNCQKIKKFEFSQPSILETIEEFAFSYSSITDIQLPETVKEIGDGVFSFCQKLEKFEFSNSKIQFISKGFFSSTKITHLSIPSSVTIIKLHAFLHTPNLRSIEIPSNSQLKKIETEAFSNSSIERFTIPSKLEELEKYWNYKAKKISEIEVVPENPYFTTYKNKFLLKKSSIEKEVFDVLILYFGNDENVLIPDFVEVIDQFSFNKCKQIRRIETSINSKLRIIKEYAFFKTSVESIILPQSLIELKEKWCYDSSNLIEIKVISGNPFFASCNNDKFLVKKSSISKENYDILILSIQNIKIAKINDDIEIIEPFAFYNCKKLKNVEFSNKSKLRIIGKFSFYKSNIEKISIPVHVTNIGESAFLECEKFENIEIPSDSELKIIEKNSFCKSLIRNIFIPSNLESICNSSFASCYALQKVEIRENSKLKEIGRCAFSLTSIESIFIPSNVVKIGSNAFDTCIKLQKVDFSKDSRLKTIKSFAFNSSAITSISIPESVKQINSNDFMSCEYLQIIELHEIPILQHYLLQENKNSVIIMVEVK